MNYQLTPKNPVNGYQNIVEYMLKSYLEMYTVVRNILDANPHASALGNIDILPKVDVDRGLGLVGSSEQIGTTLYELYLIPIQSLIMTITREFSVDKDLASKLERYLFLIDDFSHIYRFQTMFNITLPASNDMVTISHELGLVSATLHYDLEITLSKGSNNVTHILELPLINAACTSFKLSKDVNDLIADDYWMGTKVVSTGWCVYLSLNLHRRFKTTDKDGNIKLTIPAGTVLGSFDFDNNTPF